MEVTGKLFHAEWKPGKKGNYLNVGVEVNHQEAPMFFNVFGSKEQVIFQDAKGKIIKVVYEEAGPEGKWKNVTGVEIVGEVQEAKQATTQKVVNIGGDSRQESIERQSSWSRATEFAKVAVDGGYTLVMGDGKKVKATSKDPEVLFEWVKLIARRIKDDVQNGDWTNPMAIVEQENEEETGEEKPDFPF